MPAKKSISRDKLEKVRRTAFRMFAHRPNFTGVDVGYAWDGETQSDRISVRVHLARKLPLAELESHLVIPKEIDGVPIDVIQGDYRVPQLESAQAAVETRYPFLIGGASISRELGGAGTLGALVVDRTTRRPGVLSNWHVMAGPQARPGDGIVHPATMDAGIWRPRRIASLDRYILSGRGDAAVAFLDGPDVWVPLQLGGFTEVTSVRRPRLGETLTKHGRTTATTSGKVDGEGIYRLTYEIRPGVWEARDIEGFRLLSTIEGNAHDEEISQPGDSGALWVHEGSGAGVGLHFAGETSSLPADEFALACNLDSVTQALDVEIANFGDLANMAGEGEARAEFTPRPIDPWSPFDPRCPRFPRPPRPWDLRGSRLRPSGSSGPFFDIDGRSDFDDGFSGAGIERADARKVRIERLFAALQAALSRPDIGIFDSTSKLARPNDMGQAEAQIARAVNRDALCDRPVSGRELFREGGGVFYNVCYYIDQVNIGEKP